MKIFGLLVGIALLLPAAATERLMTAQEVLDILKSHAIQIVDARFEAEF